MSNQPPYGYGNQHGYGQQWPPSYTPMLPLNYPPAPEHSSQPHLPSEYNTAGSNAHSQLPGYGAQGLAFPPHVPYMHNYDPSQPPQLVPPASLPPYGIMPFVPPVPPPPPPATMNPRAQVFSQSSGVQSRGRGDSSTREEGEISEGGGSFASKGDGKSGKHDRSQRGPTTRHSDLEEGETMANKSLNSSRSSSPYNPPLSVSADADVVHRAIEMQKQDVSTSPSESLQAPKTATQLRLQALGAILSLAPHNIRYEQLLAEGINPAVLKKLYEEVGIKITPAESQKISTPSPAPTAPSVETTTRASNAGNGQLQKQGDPTKSAVQKPTLTTPRAPSQSDSGKPIERKELIAQMLAAKAAKAAEAPVSNTKPKEAQTPSSATTPSTESKSSSFPVREKNKAQTELARQRIEELKRQALLKKKQQAQLPSQPDTPATFDQPVAPSSAVQHPLPDRPPVPQSSPPSVIPGLFMTASQQQSDVPSAGGIAIDSTPVTRASYRKRPRASDFDEPEAAPGKRTSHAPSRPESAEKLIIDISEDESLYGDDEGEDMDIDSSPEGGVSPVEPSEGPSLQKHDSDTGASTSTPHDTTLSTAPDHMRQRDLEIQAMHRKIAELEQKRREKLAASRTQSPRTWEDSAILSSVAQSSVADAEVAEASTAASPEPRVASAASINGTADRPNLTSNDLLDDSVVPDAPISASTTSSDSSSSVSSEPESPVKETAENEAIKEGEEPSASPQEESSGSSMAESVDSESSAETSSEEEKSEVSDAAIEADAISASNPEEMEIDAVDQSVSAPPATAENVESERDHQSHETSDDNMESSGESEAYEPSEAQQAASGPSAASAAPSEPQVQEHQNDPDSAVSSAESDVYEPPEPGPGADSTNLADTPPFSPAPPAPVELPPSQEQAPAVKGLMDAPQAPALESRSNFGLLGSQAPSSRPKQKFSTYVSPLRNFKAYRYHPSYAEHVSDGYRSLTYSHNIDPMTYLCPFELAGGVCNDRSCEFQHFRDMTLDDDKILIQMGAIREGQTEEEKEAYLAGLKEIINEMRRDKVKDFNTVATEIAAYRRRFLQDPSRVLPL